MPESTTHISDASSWRARFSALIVLLALLQLAAGMWAMSWWFAALVPLVVVLGLVSFLFLEAGLLLLAVTLFVRIELPGLVGVYPADVLALILLGGVVLHGLTSGWSRASSNPLNAQMLAVLTVFGISLINAYNLSIGITNWLRHVQMLGVIVVTVVALDGKGVARVLKLLLVMSFVLCCPTIIEAIRTGGSQRVFGIASVFLPFYLSAGIIHCVVGYLLTEQFWRRWAWAALALTFTLGIVVAQTREAMLFVAIGLAMVGTLTWVWAGRHNHLDLRRRITWLFITGAIVVIIILSGSVGIFETSASRVHQAIEGHSNTIYIRLFLWRMGIQTFLENPLLGVGIGQFQKMAAFQPLWHFDPMAQFSQNLGAHNDAISYAAETGLIGSFTVLAFFWGIIRIGWREWQRADTVEALSRNLMVWVPCLALSVRFFYGTHMFYSLGGLFNCLYFGLLIAQSRSNEPAIYHSESPYPSGIK